MQRGVVKVKDLDTPVALVDIDIMEDNIERMHNHLSNHGLKIRPHIKTHKIPDIAHKQIEAGAVGINCQKLGEAEVMVNSGIHDVLLTYNIVGEKKLNRLVQLTRRANVTLAIDDEFVSETISETLHEHHSTANLLVELDVGGRRTGVQSPEDALNLAKQITGLRAVNFSGLMAYKGGLPDPDYIATTSSLMKDTLELFDEESIKVNEVSCAGTVYAWEEEHVFGATEWRPGLYIYNDLGKVAAGVATLDQCAMKILTTVVARPTKNRVVVDAGAKIFSTHSPYGPAEIEGYGHVVEYPHSFIYSLSEEHGKIDFSMIGSRTRPKIGDQLTIIPNYVNSVTNLVDCVYGIRSDNVEACWQVLARGKVR